MLNTGYSLNRRISNLDKKAYTLLLISVRPVTLHITLNTGYSLDRCINNPGRKAITLLRVIRAKRDEKRSYNARHIQGRVDWNCGKVCSVLRLNCVPIRYGRPIKNMLLLALVFFVTFLCVFPLLSIAATTEKKNAIPWIRVIASSHSSELIWLGISYTITFLIKHFCRY